MWLDSKSNPFLTIFDNKTFDNNFQQYKAQHLPYALPSFSIHYFYRVLIYTPITK